jgi:hypothetical protein
MFKLYPSTKKFNIYNQNVRIVHVLGTHGFGKSSCLYGLKIILDLRIKQVIKNGRPKDSIFDKDIKLFYFNAIQQP